MNTADTKTVVEALETLLADSYTLYLKTHSYHWNVKGPMFSTLHTMFETQYTELALAVDEIAERIRALGSPAPGSYSQFMKSASVKEDPTVPKATDMISNLVADSELVVTSARLDAAQSPGVVGPSVRIQNLHAERRW